MKKSISWLRPDPSQPRKVFSKVELKDLADTFKTERIIHPIEVDSSGMIIVGERRWRAAQIAGMKELEEGKDFVINDRKLSPYERLRRQIVENCHHSSLSGGATTMDPFDEARAFDNMLKLKGDDLAPGARRKENDRGITQLSKELGIPQRTISNALLLLEEPQFVEDAIVKRNIPKSLFRSTRSIEDPKLRETVKRKIASGELKTSSEVEHVSAVIRENPTAARIQLSKEIDHQTKKANEICTVIRKLCHLLSENPLSTLPAHRSFITHTVNDLEKVLKKFLHS